MGQRAVATAVGVALGIALVLMAPWRPRYRTGLTVLGIIAALGSLVLLVPFWTVSRDNPYRRDSEEEARRRRRPRRAGRTWLGMTRGFLRFLGVLGAVWLVLVLASPFFPIKSPVPMLEMGFGVPLFFAGWLWLAHVGTQDGIPWWWFLPRGVYSRRPLGWVRQYVRERPERAANPFGLAMLGGLMVLANFVWLPLYSAIRNASAPAQPAPQAPPPPGARPAQVLFERGPRLYLAELLEFDVHSGPWNFAKDGTVGDPNRTRIQVRGAASPNGLGMHPPGRPGQASAGYRLGKKAALFKPAVAINDSSPSGFRAAVFEVWGGG